MGQPNIDLSDLIAAIRAQGTLNGSVVEFINQVQPRIEAAVIAGITSALAADDATDQQVVDAAIGGVRTELDAMRASGQLVTDALVANTPVPPIQSGS